MTPRGQITRDIHHRYTFEGTTYPGVTGILGVLDKSGPLMGWAAKGTATAALKLFRDGSLATMLETVGDAGTIKALTARSEWERDTAASIGTAIHGYADDIAMGRELTVTDPGVLKRVNLYAEWWKASGWTLRLSEAYVVNDAGYGGTFDLLARDPDGRTVLADVKTGKGVYAEAALQLAAYGMADHVCPVGSDVSFPMPRPDRYVILHVTEAGVREVEMVVGDAERAAFYACMELARWRDSTKGRRL